MATLNGQKMMAVARATTATGVGLILIMALTGGALRVDDNAYESLYGSTDPGASRVIPYDEHPASSIVDTDTRKLMATRHIPGYGGA